MVDEAAIEEASGSSLRDIYYVIFRQKWKILLFFLATVLTVTAGTFLVPKIYRSESQLLVRLGRESVSLDPTATTGPVISVAQSRENEIKSELEILKSRDLIEKVVDAIGPSLLLYPPKESKENLRPPSERRWSLFDSSPLGNPLTDREKAILLVTKKLEIEVLKNTNIISIAYEAENRTLAQETIEKLIGFYLEKHINVHRTQGSYEFFDQQTDQIRNHLAKTEEDLRQLKNKTGIASLGEQRSVLFKRTGDLQQQVAETEAALVASRAKVEAIQKNLADVPETLVTQESSGHQNQAADLMRARLYELQIREQDLLIRYGEKNKLIQDVRRQIAEARAILDKEEPTRTQVTRGLNEAHIRLEGDLLSEKATLSSLQEKAKEQRAQLASARAELKPINDQETQMAQVQRDASIQEANYRKYDEKLEQARIDHALEMGKISNISVVQPATYPLKPVRPRKLLNLALGLFLGLFGGLGLAFFSETMDHTFKKPEDIEERLKLPTLATIPHSKTIAFYGLKRPFFR